MDLNVPSPQLSTRGALRVRTIASRQVERCRRLMEDLARPLATRDLTGQMLKEVESLDSDQNDSRRDAKAGLYAEGIDIAWLHTVALDDACRGFVDLTEAGRTILAVLPVARSSIDAAVNLEWLFDRDLTASQRLVRIAATMWLDIEYARQSRTLGPTVDTDVDQGVEEFESLISLADILSSVPEKGARRFWSLEAPQRISGRVNMTESLKGDPELMGYWRLASGAAHARPWLINSELVPNSDVAHGTHLVAAISLIRACSMARKTISDLCDNGNDKNIQFFENAKKAVGHSLGDSSQIK